MDTDLHRGPAHQRLDPLVGSWRMHALSGGDVVASGTVTFDWIEDGAFLLQRAVADPPTDSTPELWVQNSPFPTTTVIGVDDRTDTYSFAYSDARDVHRVYRMTLDDGRWQIFGQSGPEFFQRFTGTFSADGRTIDARWETSSDDETWTLDFEQTYTQTD